MCAYSIRAIVWGFLSVTKPAHHMLNVVECLSCVFQWMPCVFNIWLFSVITTSNVWFLSVVDIVSFNLWIWKWNRTQTRPHTHSHTQIHTQAVWLVRLIPFLKYLICVNLRIQIVFLWKGVVLLPIGSDNCWERNWLQYQYYFQSWFVIGGHVRTGTSIRLALKTLHTSVAACRW